ncbi:hypothetical protein [Gemmatirosa kalamazoonensis]|uniref:hypothetical protein n=1 Tax=Gemmatirosa kalamazoonensis TaxID=861299 RepID=UPI00046D1E70|nr:hypothetical protein [Gemmatirosa kalamazoonensis]
MARPDVPFTEALLLLGRYYESYVGRADPTVVLELRVRLRQAKFLYEQAMEVHDRLWDAQKQPNDEEEGVQRVAIHTEPYDQLPQLPPGLIATIFGDQPFAEDEAVRTYAESFYYIAHRILVVLRQCGAGLPGVGRVRAEGVGRVRNNVLEHSNKPGGNQIVSTVISVSGPRLGSLRRASAPASFNDAGLPDNACEFVTSLIDALKSALQEAGDPEPAG